ncbi:MAG: exopolysaccharide Pel transporter PelG [Lachnospiraceae bacterium]|nr:exopolysaccharide Pel transporter PelG [Lachnospiraceae bacterium]
MAGIGFELKKIFKERSIVSMFRGAIYSTFVTIGPMLIIMVFYLALLLLMGYRNVSFEERDLLVSIILYTFIFSLILTSPLGAAVSRFIADKIFEERFDDILAGFYAGLLTNVIIAGSVSIPFIVITISRGNVDPLLMVLAGALFMALVFVFYEMTFISALKDYHSITMAYLIGMGITLIVATVLFYVFHVEFLISVLGGMALGFTLIAMNLFAQILRYFTTNSHNYRAFLQILWKYRLLFIGNLFYVFGLYIHNFVFWFNPSLRIVVADTFRSAPVYDTATFLAMLTNISVTVIFTVRVEIKFHEKYQIFCQQILGGIGEDIEMAKKNMFMVLRNEIVFLVQIQTIISAIFFMLLSLFAPFLGFGGMVMVIYPAVAAGFFVLFMMYCTMVFLFYYDDQTGALITSVIFFSVTLTAALLLSNSSPNYYGLALFAGGMVSLFFALFRLRYVERTIDRRIFCRGKLLNVSGE